MPVLAMKATYDPHKGTLFINGDEFPYYLTEHGVSVSAAHHGTTTLNVSILIEQVEVLTWNKSQVADHA
jgi:hypothetical protein